MKCEKFMKNGINSLITRWGMCMRSFSKQIQISFFESREVFGDAMVIEHSSSWINFVKNIFDESEEKFSFYNFTMKNYN